MSDKKNWKKVSVRHSAEIAALHQKAGLKIKELVNLFPQYSQRSIYRHSRREIGEEEPEDKRKKNKGRPPILTVRDKRRILRAIPILRQKEGWFTAKRLAVETGVVNKVTIRTVRKFLNKTDYFYLQARKKGLLSKKDFIKKSKFCRKIENLGLGLHFWTHCISFYLDGKGFTWKSNPQDQARTHRSRIWRKPSEGLDFGCTAKAGKAGTTNLNFMVAISYNHGVVLCERYHGTISGAKFAKIVLDHFPESFKNSSNPKGKRLLQDGCPRQNSKMALEAFDKVNAKLFRIPARSPDLNPIENFFHLVSRKLEKDSKKRNITKESKEQFEQRIKDTMQNFRKDKIDKTIESIPKRDESILKGRAKRL